MDTHNYTQWKENSDPNIGEGPNTQVSMGYQSGQLDGDNSWKVVQFNACEGLKLKLKADRQSHEKTKVSQREKRAKNGHLKKEKKSSKKSALKRRYEELFGRSPLSRSPSPSPSRSPSIDPLQPFPDSYRKRLEDLQSKILALQNKADLQKVYEVVYETGEYRSTESAITIDLCALDKSTIKRLEGMFTS